MNASSTTIVKVPPYVRPLRPLADPLILDFCNRKGVFEIPDRDIVVTVLESYFDFCNPFLPMLDRAETLRTVQHGPDDKGETDSDARLSLLLLRTLLFAGSSTVDATIINAMGFNNRLEARKTLFHRARYFYDFDLETDGLALLPSLLLFSFWVELDDARGPWHWICAATSCAQAIDLSGMLAQTQATTDKGKALRRLWWSCCIRETTVALGMKCSPSLKPAECRVPMLTLDDFEIPEQCKRGSVDDTHALAQTSPDIYKALASARISIEIAKLCVIFSKIPLSPRELGLSQPRGVVERVTEEPTDDSGDAIFSIAWRIRHSISELTQWLKNLPDEAHGIGFDTDEATQIHPSIAVHQTLLHMSYFTAIINLYMPGVLLLANNSRPLAVKLNRFYRRKLVAAVLEVSSLAESLTRRQLTRYLPSYCLSCLIQAMVVCLFEFRRCRGKPRQDIVHGTSTCMRLLADLDDRFPSAGGFWHYFRGALREFQPGDGDGASPQSQTPSPLQAALSRGGPNAHDAPQQASAVATIGNPPASNSMMAPAIPYEGLGNLLGTKDAGLAKSSGAGDHARRISTPPEMAAGAINAVRGPWKPLITAPSTATFDFQDLDAWNVPNPSLELLLYNQLSDAVNHHDNVAGSSAEAGEVEKGQGKAPMSGTDMLLLSDDMEGLEWPLDQNDAFMF